MVETLRGYGLVGEERAVKLIYLAVTSRLLTRIASIAVKGPSSGGKSFLVEIVLKLFPPEAFYVLTAMSEHALAYGDEALSHRILVLYEAAGLTGEFGTYLVRSLLSEGRICYDTVEKTKDGLKSRRIEREGPTGLLTTTTAVHLHPENETRLLSLTVTDTPAQTKAVMRAQARRQGRADHIDLASWHAPQPKAATATGTRPGGSHGVTCKMNGTACTANGGRLGNVRDAMRRLAALRRAVYPTATGFTSIRLTV